MDQSENEIQTGSGSNLRSGLRLFLDSADPEQWARFLPLGIFHGITTNPLLLERADQACTLENLEELACKAKELGAREIHLQTWGNAAKEMVDIGQNLAGLGRLGLDVVVKIPVTEDGLKVASTLMKSGCRVTLTAVYSAGQALASAGLGAAYAAPYLGRLDDAEKDGAASLDLMRSILVNNNSNTRLLVASLRTTGQVIELASRGFNTLTFGPTVAEGLLEEELTVKAALDFQLAAEKMARSK